MKDTNNVANKKRKTVEYGKYGYLFILPFFIVFLVFQLYPLLLTFWESIFQTVKSGRNNVEIVMGFGNYADYVFGDKGNGELWKSLGVTIVMWIMNFIPQILLSLLLAAWFTDKRYKLKGQGAYKVIMYMPNIITAATIAVLFFNLFDVHGSITNLLRMIGIVHGDVGILDRGFWAVIVIAFIQFWMWYGNTMIILIAGILGISPSLYEAAMVDGATSNQQFFQITIPLLKPILQYTLVTSAIGGLQMYDIPQLFNSGVPGGPIVKLFGLDVNSTQTVIMLIKSYVESGAKQNYGRAAAYSVVLFGITLVVSLIFYFATAEKKKKA